MHLDIFTKHFLLFFSCKEPQLFLEEGALLIVCEFALFCFVLSAEIWTQTILSLSPPV